MTNRVLSIAVAVAAIGALSSPLRAACTTVLYDNTTSTGWSSTPGTGIEWLDWGTTTGGTVCGYRIRYTTTAASPGTITVRFYSGTTSSTCPGTLLATHSLSGLNGSGQWEYEIDLTGGNEFILPSGPVGYSYEFDNAATGVSLRSGGTGNEDLFWEDCVLSWFGGSPFAGFYMRLYTSDGTPNIRVDPMSLTLDCVGAQPPPAPGGPLAAVAGTRSPAQKLVDAPAIVRPFEDGNLTTHVIVTLARPFQARAATDWDDADSVRRLRGEVKALQDELLAGLSGSEVEVEYRLDNLAAFSGHVTQAGLDRLLNDPRVESVEPVRIVEAHLNQGIPLMNALTYRATYGGAGLAVAICDTGIDYTHSRLGGGGFPNAKVIGGYDFGSNDADPMPVGNAHGTACAGIAAGNLGTVGDYIGGVAPDAKLYALKITPDNSGSATSSAIAAAWDWCVTHRNDDPSHPIRVISTSFGGGRYYGTCDAAVPTVTSAAANAVAAGITVLASAGNDGFCDSIAWPACIGDVVSVGAVYDGAWGSYSPCVNAGSCVTKYASGGCSTGYYAIDATAPDKVTSYSNSASFLDLLAPSNQAYTTDIAGAGGYASGDFTSSFGGTSAACPYAAGAVASLQTAAKAITGNYLTPAQVRSTLAATGDNITDTKNAITKPRVNLGRAIETVAPCTGATFTIYNDGNQTLNVTSVTRPAWASLSALPPYSIAAGASLTVCVTADCGACAGADLDDVLAVQSNDPDTPTVQVAVHVDCCAWVFFDFDHDCDVDLNDYADFEQCLAGPNGSPPPGCTVNADCDAGGDVDMPDFSRFQQCYNGAGWLPPISCPTCP